MKTLQLDPLVCAIAQHLPVALIVADREGNILLENEQARSCLSDALPNERVADHETWEVLHAEGRPFAPEELWLNRALAGETLHDEEAQIRMPSGTVRHIRGNAAPILGEGGDIVGAMTSFSDVTEKFEAARERDLLLGVLGHDLRGPLHVLHLVTSLACSEEGGDPESLAIAQRAKQRMDRMIDQLLEFARARSGALRLACTDGVDLTRICRAVAEEIGYLHPGCEIDLDLPEELSGCWDPDRLYQILFNLIKNAIEHGGCEQVRVKAFHHGEGVSIRVANPGSMIPAELFGHLFEPFQAGGKGRGFGLGLYITRRFAELHGGKIELEPGEGETRFHVTLPLRPPEAARGASLAAS